MSMGRLHLHLDNADFVRHQEYAQRETTLCHSDSVGGEYQRRDESRPCLEVRVWRSRQHVGVDQWASIWHRQPGGGRLGFIGEAANAACICVGWVCEDRVD